MIPSHLLDNFFAGIITFSVVSNVHAAIYHIDQYIQNNGSNTYADKFSDGFEPPAGPLSSNDYIVHGTFANNRESGGLLELNTADGAPEEGDIELVSALGNSSYFFTSGSGGFVEGTFEINNGFTANSYIQIGIDNFQLPGSGNNTESVSMGIVVDSKGGTIHVQYGHNVFDDENDNLVDITSDFGTNTKMTMKLTVDSVTNNVTAYFDFGSNGTIDLTRNNYATLQFVAGQYTGTFQSNLSAAPVSPAVWLFWLLD